jgi:hypothetical protein
MLFHLPVRAQFVRLVQAAQTQLQYLLSANKASIRIKLDRFLVEHVPRDILAMHRILRV